jgi:hypothetical protein
MSPTNRPTVKADSRGRVSLVKYGDAKPGQMFLIEVRDDGVIELTPATAVPVGTANLSD